MDQVQLGKLIAELRRKAGYTQKSLADALQITDKAISKWERGICLPDSSMLPKLAGLLDTDLGSLMLSIHNKEQWKGVIVFNDGETNPNTLVNGKPLLHYLLSYFLLLEITDISIITTQEQAIKNMNLSQYGINVSFEPVIGKKTMVVFGKMMLFGAYLSRQLLNMMASEEDVIPVIDNITVPMVFIQGSFSSIDEKIIKAKRKTLYRGIVNLPLDSMDNVKDAETFIRIYENYHRIEYCNLKEIATSRGLL